MLILIDMITLIIAIILIALNHTINSITYGELGYDVTAIDICIGIGYLLFLFL